MFFKNADVFFIASRSKDVDGPANNGVDMSHRGGERGFITVIDDQTLSFADYPGNRFFNTLGNIQCDPRVGLLFLDLDKQRTLHVKATAEIEWIGEERSLKIHVDHVLVRKNENLKAQDFL